MLFLEKKEKKKPQTVAMVWFSLWITFLYICKLQNRNWFLVCTKETKEATPKGYQRDNYNLVIFGSFISCMVISNYMEKTEREIAWIILDVIMEKARILVPVECRCTTDRLINMERSVKTPVKMTSRIATILGMFDL